MMDALTKSENKCRTLLENLPQKIFFKDMNLVYVSCNENYARDLKIKSNEIAGKTDHNFYPKELAEKYRADDKRIMKSGKTEDIEEEYIQDGQKVFVHTVKAPVKDEKGNVVGVLGIFWDITERNKVEATLRRLAIVVSDSNDAITVMNLDGTISAWNKGAERMYGYSENEALGMNITDIVTEEKRRETVEFIERIKSSDSVESFETNRLTKDGRVLNVWLTVTRTVDDNGKVVAIATTERDVTERKRLQEESVASEGLAAIERLAAIGQLASAIGHEIRNPLGVIKNSAYFLNMKLKDAADEKVVKHLKILEKEVNSANLIISDLLDFARKKPPTLDQTDLNETVKNTLASITVPENIKVEIKLGEIPEMLLDKEQVQRVCQNIILNAVQAMPEGGKLAIQTTKQDDSAKLMVRDTGVGIPKENMPKLFTPLHSTKAKGIGLGLVICKQIVEGHDGNITVESRVGEGSTFTVRLPIRMEKEISEQSAFTVSMPVEERVKIGK